MRYGRWLTVIAGAMAASTLIGMTTTTLAWGQSLVEDQRLLPGTKIAGVDVGERTADDAADEVRAHIEAQLETEVELTAAGERWVVSAADLDAEPDIESAIAEALARTEAAGLLELSRLRLMNAGADIAVEVETGIDADRLHSFVATIAEEIDRAPRDATLDWNGGRIELTDSRTGRTLVRDDAANRIESVLLGPATEAELPVRTTDPAVATEALAPVADELHDLVNAALDRKITITVEDLERTVTPRELDVTPDIDTLLEQARTDVPDTAPTFELPDAPGDVPLHVPDDAIDEVVAELASEVDQPARDAQLDWSSGALQIVDARTGRSLDTASAHAQITDAIRGTTAQVELEVSTTQPSVTADDYDHVLYLRVDQRTLRYYRDGEVVREWPVAVGQPSNPTPTGVFTVGAKRVDPTWTNPAPDGWGSDMPEIVGPGPDNPMGPRAINWNQNGRDTLIRFHGTNNPDSIGTAASRGCVRLYNDDVRELFDLVPQGATIVSTGR